MAVILAEALVLAYPALMFCDIPAPSVLLHALETHYLSLRTVNHILIPVTHEGVVLHSLAGKFLIHQNSPVITPSGEMSIPSAAGTLGRPGIVMMDPA